MNYAPLIRIAIRYGVGLFIGNETAEMMAGDTELVDFLAVAAAALVGVATEYAYAKAVKYGWAK